MHAQQHRPLSEYMISRWSQLLYVFVAWLFALCIVVQAFLAGLNIFAGTAWWAIHVEAGHRFNPIPILLLLAFPGRFPRSIVLLSGLLFIQYEVQVALIELAGSLHWPVLAAFHPARKRCSQDSYWILGTFAEPTGTDGRPITCKTTSVTGRQIRPVHLQSARLFSCLASFIQERMTEVASTGV